MIIIIIGRHPLNNNNLIFDHLWPGRVHLGVHLRGQNKNTKLEDFFCRDLGGFVSVFGLGSRHKSANVDHFGAR